MLRSANYKQESFFIYVLVCIYSCSKQDLHICISTQQQTIHKAPTLNTSLLLYECKANKVMKNADMKLKQQPTVTPFCT